MISRTADTTAHYRRAYEALPPERQAALHEQERAATEARAGAAAKARESRTAQARHQKALQRLRQAARALHDAGALHLAEDTRGLLRAAQRWCPEKGVPAPPARRKGRRGDAEGQMYFAFWAAA